MEMTIKKAGMVETIVVGGILAMTAGWNPLF